MRARILPAPARTGSWRPAAAARQSRFGFPDSPRLVAATVTAELYFGHADNDPSLPPEQIARLNAALDADGVRYRAEVYDGATHGRTMSDTRVYNEAAEQRHWNAACG